MLFFFFLEKRKEKLKNLLGKNLSMPVIRRIVYNCYDLPDDIECEHVSMRFYASPFDRKRYLKEDGTDDVHYRIIKRHGIYKIFDHLFTASWTGLVKSKILRSILRRLNDSRYRMLPIDNTAILLNNNVKYIILDYLDKLINNPAPYQKRSLICREIGELKKLRDRVKNVDPLIAIMKVLLKKKPRFLKQIYNLSIDIINKNNNSTLTVQLETYTLIDNNIQAVRKIILTK